MPAETSALAAQLLSEQRRKEAARSGIGKTQRGSAVADAPPAADEALDASPPYPSSSGAGLPPPPPIGGWHAELVAEEASAADDASFKRVAYSDPNNWMAPETAGWSEPGRPSAIAADPRREPEPADADEVLLVHRRVVYGQAVVLAVTIIVCMAMGYLIGRGSRPPLRAPGGDETAAAEIVLLLGELSASTSDGKTVRDAGAVAIALPTDRLPQPAIATGGLRPRDNVAKAAAGIEAIHRLGGDYVRAESDGTFELVVARPGTYHVLFISAAGLRGGGESLDAEVLARLEEYFASPVDLIGANRYRLQTVRLEAGALPMGHHFSAAN